jgi:acyl-CoA thioesterase-2
MDPALTELLDVLNPRQTGPGRFDASSAALGGRRVVFGGQILAQMVVVASRTVPDLTVKSLHALFVRAATFSQPLQFDVDVHHTGRLYASATVSVSQGDRLCARALILSDRADVELARHAPEMPGAPGPETLGPVETIGGGLEVRLVGDVDLGDPDAVGPPELRAWARFPGAPADDALSRGLIAYATEPFFWGTALRPHRGLGSALAFVTVTPAVITHSVTFHEAIDVSTWFLLDLTSPYMGRGRIYGHGSVYALDGTLAASVSQENQLRPADKPY